MPLTFAVCVIRAPYRRPRGARAAASSCTSISRCVRSCVRTPALRLEAHVTRAGPSPLNTAILNIQRRAEAAEADRIDRTFVDVGFFPMLATTDHQIVYGRRGIGKTHALQYLAESVRERGDLDLPGSRGGHRAARDEHVRGDPERT